MGPSRPGTRGTVLHTESSSGWGGQEVRILAELSWLRERGWRALLACQPNSPIFSHARKAGTEAFPLAMRGAWDLSALIGFLRLIRRERVALIHTHSSADSWLGGFGGRLSRIPVVRSRHVSIPARVRGNPVYSLLTDRVVTSGEAIRRILVDAGADPAKVVAIPAGVDLAKFGPGSGGERIRKEFGLEGAVIGSVAMFRGSKGHLHLLDAFSLLRDRLPGAHLLLVGDGIRRPWVEELARERGLAGSVHFTGFRRDVPDLLRAMDCFVLASTRTEGVPQSLLQALAVGVPVVASEIGGIPEVIEHRVTGLLVPPGEPSALAAAVEETLADPAASRKRALAGRELVGASFSRSHSIDALERLYAALIAP